MINLNENRGLTKLEKFLLKKIILDKPERPSTYKFSELYRFFDYEKHSENEIKDIIQSLVQKDFLQEDRNYYTLTRNTFLKLKQRHKYLILFFSDYNKLSIPILAGLITAIISLFPTIKDFLKPTPKIEFQAEALSSFVDSLKASNSSIDTGTNSKLILDSTYLSKEIRSIKKNYVQLSDNVTSLNTLLQDNPTKFIEIATLKRNVEDLKQQVQSNNESLKRDIDRISSYNNTLIVFMITFLVAYIGVGVFNFISKNKNAEI